MSRILSLSATVVLVLIATYTTEGAKFGGWRPTKGPRAQKGGGGMPGGDMGGMPGGGDMDGMGGGDMGGMPPGGAGGMGGMPGGMGGGMPGGMGGGMPGGMGGGMPGGMGGGMGGAPGGAGQQGGQQAMDEDQEENADGYDFDKMGPPGQNGGTKPQIDKCLKSVLKFCPMYRMEANFADFINCVVDHRTRVRSDCFDWAENHSPCASEIQRLCNAKNPPQTTECIYQQKDQFGQKCRESEFMTTLIEGWDQFKENSEAYGGKPAEGHEDYASKSGEDYDELPDKQAAGGGSGSEGDL